MLSASSPLGNARTAGATFRTEPRNCQFHSSHPPLGRRLLKRKFVRVGPATESPSHVIKAWVTTFRGKEVSLADCPHVLPMSPRREQRHDRLLGWIGSELVGIQWSEPQQCLILTDQRRLGQRGEPNR